MIKFDFKVTSTEAHAEVFVNFNKYWIYSFVTSTLSLLETDLNKHLQARAVLWKSPWMPD